MNREEKKQATRTKLLQAAIDLFAEQGYEATTVAQITDKAGVAKGTFFNYFCNKENVLAELKTKLTVDEARRLLEQPGPIAPQLEALVLQLTEHLRGPRPLTLAVFQGIIGTSSALDIQNEQIADMRDALVPMFETGQGRGEFVKELPPAGMADLAVQTFFGALLLWGMGHGDDCLETHMRKSFQPFFQFIST
ncbi:TetR/AcrR family transcriptional regulator [Paenibacillus chartarius]|uniref:TetR/AcrR family transcriptional regulator n=1 Tax=Paenibacillus chartarius TaxID=747481 RepID=A0ABV6DJF0_9BACL